MTRKMPVDQVDHKNRIKTDNRWANLRQCSRSQNMANAVKSWRNKSGFKGVSWHKLMNKWCSEIQFRGTRYKIGYFTSKESAALAYNKKAKELFGEYAYLNKIPTKQERSLKASPSF